MSEQGKTGLTADNKKLALIVIVVAAVLVGWYLYSQKNDKQTATLKIGDTTISTTIEQ
jgi:predicted negative regulator of RcsB-dependent stress response